MPEPLLTLLKLCALALLYLFFIRVLRAVWAEVAPARVATPAGGQAQRQRPPGPAKASRRRSAKPPGDALVVLEPRDQQGHSYPLADELTIGRAAGCAITLDDTYVSQLHARVFHRDGELRVEDLGSTNGTYVNGQKLTGAVPLKRGDHVRIGGTVLEVDA